MSSSPELDRVHELVEPIASDLSLEIYDVERRGGTIRITLDTPPGSEGGVTLDDLSLATRLIGREFDHVDPIPGKYTLEVTSPGLERVLRTPRHFQREVGKDITVRLRDITEGDRRLDGQLVSADDDVFVMALAGGEERSIGYAHVDKARTVFEWGPKPKPKAPGKQGKHKAAASSVSSGAQADNEHTAGGSAAGMDSSKGTGREAS